MDSIVTAVDIRRRYGEGDAAVNALAGALERLRAAGVEVDEETQDQEGNRFELWEPAEGV